MIHDVFELCLGDGRPGTRAGRFGPTADQVAVTDGRRSVTYQELSDRVNHAAAMLTKQGIGQGVLVGVSARPSLNAVITILAVVRAGATFVPVDDREGPSAEVHARLSCMATSPKGAPDELRLEPLGDSQGLPFEVGARPAYVMTTSGSSGRPKDTVVTVQGLRHVFHALHNRLRAVLPRGARWTQLHPLTFGYSMCEIFGTFAFAGELVIVPRESPLTLEGLFASTVDRDDHVVCLTPSELVLLVQRMRRLPTVRLPSHLLLSGEPVHKAPLAELFKLPGADRVTVVNTYAATETSGQVTAMCVTPDLLAAINNGFVGDPLPGVVVTLCDPNGSPLAPSDTDVVGEIHISGPSLAAGYLDPGATERHFRRRQGTTTGVEYRTGDLGKWGADGGLYVIGRADRRIKLGGRWVDLDAVERQVRTDGDVDDVAVLTGGMAVEDGRAHSCLVVAVVVVPTNRDGGAAARIRRRVCAQLATPFTVRLVLLEQIPRLPSGKVDLAGLSSPSEPPVTPLTGDPFGEIASRVRLAWTAVLGAGVTTGVNLFEAGVDSVGLIAVAARLTRELGRAVTPEFLLDNPRLELQIEQLNRDVRIRPIPDMGQSAMSDAAAVRRQVRLQQRQHQGGHQ